MYVCSHQLLDLVSILNKHDTCQRIYAEYLYILKFTNTKHSLPSLIRSAIPLDPISGFASPSASLFAHPIGLTFSFYIWLHLLALPLHCPHPMSSLHVFSLRMDKPILETRNHFLPMSTSTQLNTELGTEGPH